MRVFRVVLVAIALAGGGALSSATAATTCPPLLATSPPRLQDEKPVPLCQFAGRVLLVVNTASQCGYTPQYEGLERLYQRYRTRGLVVLGFPSNDFGGQEPGGNEKIAEFCENQFSVRFPMFAKAVVKGSGPAVNPLYVELARRSGQAPGWNFHKYLVDRRGERVMSYPSEVEPEDPRLLKDIERLLDAK